MEAAASLRHRKGSPQAELWQAEWHVLGTPVHSCLVREWGAGAPAPRPPYFPGSLCFMGALRTSHEGNIKITLDSHFKKSDETTYKAANYRGKVFYVLFSLQPL